MSHTHTHTLWALRLGLAEYVTHTLWAVRLGLAEYVTHTHTHTLGTKARTG